MRAIRFMKTIRRKQPWANTSWGNRTVRSSNIWRLLIGIAFVLSFSFMTRQLSVHFSKKAQVPVFMGGIVLDDLKHYFLLLQPQQKFEHGSRPILAAEKNESAELVGKAVVIPPDDKLRPPLWSLATIRAPMAFISLREMLRGSQEARTGEKNACNDQNSTLCNSRHIALNARDGKKKRSPVFPPPPDPENDDYELQLLDDGRGGGSLGATRDMRSRMQQRQEMHAEILAERRLNRGRITPQLHNLMYRQSVMERLLQNPELKVPQLQRLDLQKPALGSSWVALLTRAKAKGLTLWTQFEGKGLSWATPLLHHHGQIVAEIPALFIGIFSSPMHVSRRQACRDTWLRYPDVLSGKVTYRFFVGLHRNHTVDKDLLAENSKYGDLVMLPFMDSYYVIPLKTLAIARYAARNCSATYVMKTDDDAFIRVDQVLLRLNQTGATERLFYGALVTRSRPVRMRKSKWYISREEWPRTHYPAWAHGAGYVFTRDIAQYISRTDEAGNLPLFRLEDIGMAIWVDGMVQKGLNITYVDDQKLVFDGCRTDYLLAHYHTPVYMLCLWRQLQEANDTRCCQAFKDQPAA